MSTTPTPPARADDDGWVSARIGRGRYRTELRARGHLFMLDEPPGLGGTDAGPSPYEALLASVGACTVITLRMYADRKGWPLEAVEVRLRTAASHADDCDACELEEVGPHRVERTVTLEGALDDEQRRRLLQIADRCPIKQVLERGLRVAEAAAPAAS